MQLSILSNSTLLNEADTLQDETAATGLKTGSERKCLACKICMPGPQCSRPRLVELRQQFSHE
jgi:hypothetical protein